MQPFCRELQAAGMLDLTNPSWLSKHRLSDNVGGVK